MTDLGYSKGVICELLNCSPSELEKRCPEVTDEEFLIAYYNRKNEMERQGLHSPNGA